MATGRLELCNRIRMEAEDIERTGFPLEVLPQAVQSVILVPKPFYKLKSRDTQCIRLFLYFCLSIKNMKHDTPGTYPLH